MKWLTSPLPPWAKWAFMALALVAAANTGYVLGLQRGADQHLAYVAKQAAAATRIVQAQTKVVTKIEVVYRDRIQKIYVEGKNLEDRIPDYVKPADDQRFGVNVGFVRVLTAAWTGTAPGPAADSDREPSAVPLADLAAVETGNITSCRAWREQALGWRQFYAEQQVAINGRAGAWYQEVADGPDDPRSAPAAP